MTADFRPGDIVKSKPASGANIAICYVVQSCRAGWVYLKVARKDGQPDRRWTGFSGSAEQYEIVEEKS